MTTDVVVTGVPFTVVVEPSLHVWIVVGVVTVVVVIGVVFLTTVVIGVVATVVMFLFTDRICSCLVGVRVVVATALVVPLVLATQTLIQSRAKNFKISVDGKLPLGVTAKDVILSIIGNIGTAGGTGYVIEYCGEVFRNFSMEERMTVCNMSIEAGARAGLVAPDQKTFDYIKGRPLAPKGENWEKALKYWSTLYTDKDAKFDRELYLQGKDIEPTVTWGTSPQDTASINGKVPDPNLEKNEDRKKSILRSLDYMGLEPSTAIQDIKIDKVFIGSCTNGRIEDLREVAKIVKGKKVNKSVDAIVVPGSGLVKLQAEKEGLDKIFKDSVS